MDSVIALVLQVKFCFLGWLEKANALVSGNSGGEIPKEKHFTISSHNFDEGRFERDLKVIIVCIYTVR